MFLNMIKQQKKNQKCTINNIYYMDVFFYMCVHKYFLKIIQSSFVFEDLLRFTLCIVLIKYKTNKQKMGTFCKKRLPIK